MGFKPRGASVQAWRDLRAKFEPFEPSTRDWPESAFASDLPLPASYLVFMEEFGPGTIGDFLHLQPPAYLSTYRERMSSFMDADLEEMLAESGGILIFADSDNGDALGWLSSTLRRGGEPPVLRLPPRSFDAVPIADGFLPLIQRLAAGEDLFRRGPLPPTYRPMPPFDHVSA